MPALCLLMLTVSAVGLTSVSLYPILLCLGLMMSFGKLTVPHVKPCQSCRPQFRHFGFATLLRSVLLVLSCRIGEAANPGPDATEQCLRDFCIGSFNPSGLPNKAMVVHEHLSHGHLWLVSETHLSDQAGPEMHQFTLPVLYCWTSCS